MKIERIGNTKNINAETERIVISVKTGTFTFTEEPDGALLIHRNAGQRLNLVPRCRNQVEIY